MSSKTRVPNKVQWGLLDIIAESESARQDWQAAMKVAERNGNHLFRAGRIATPPAGTVLIFGCKSRPPVWPQG